MPQKKKKIYQNTSLVAKEAFCPQSTLGTLVQ